MLSVVGLLHIGDLGGLVVGLERPELEVKLLIRNILAGRNHGKELGREIERWKNSVKDPMIDCGTGILGRKGIVIENGIKIETKIGREIVAVVVIEFGTGTVTVIMTVTMIVLMIETMTERMNMIVVAMMTIKGRHIMTKYNRCLIGNNMVIGTETTIMNLNMDMIIMEILLMMAMNATMLTITILHSMRMLSPITEL